jgi:Sensors of blue-light using FAD
MSSLAQINPTFGFFRPRQSTMGIIKLIYVSAATKPFTQAGLRELLAKARANNSTVCVTGLLLYHKESFSKFSKVKKKLWHRSLPKSNAIHVITECYYCQRRARRNETLTSGAWGLSMWTGWRPNYPGSGNSCAQIRRFSTCAAIQNWWPNCLMASTKANGVNVLSRK